MTDLANPLIDALEPLISRVRTDVTAKKMPDGTSRWTREPLTRELHAQHHNGGPARGVCPIKEGESVTFCTVLDFDSHRGEVSWGRMCLVVASVADLMTLRWGMTPTVFRSSGGRGVHLYVLWDQPQDAYSVRCWVREVLAPLGLREGNTGGLANNAVEVFPKQDAVEVGGFGNQFILPLAGSSEVLEYDELSGGYIGLGKVAPPWHLDNPPVKLRERPVRVTRAVIELAGTSGDDGGVPLWRQALDAIPNEGPDAPCYDWWWKIVAAIHHETDGSPEGFAIALTWSMRNGPVFAKDPGHLEDRVWPYIRSDGRAAVTGGGTICHYAATHHGWREPLIPLGPIPDPDVIWVLSEDSTSDKPILVPLEEPNFDRERNGAIKPTVSNTVVAVRRPDLCGLRVGHDEFRDEITVSREGVDEWAAMTDADVVRIRMRLEGMGFKSAPKETCRDAVVLVAAENRYDSAQLWLSGLHWDGVPRVESFLVRFLGCEDTPYTRAVALYLWTALAGRVLVPGIKVDMVPIFEGDQGLRKSSAIEALAPAQEFFVEIDLEEKEDDTVRKLRGALVGEIAELSGLHTRALEAIKKFVVRKTEKWVPKYKEFPSTFQRRLVFIGTTNRTDILADETGNRRWLPLHVTAADVEGIVAARDQLWAEGAALFRRLGVAWQDAERLAVVDGGAHDRYTVEDSWAAPVSTWLSAPEPFDGLSEEGEIPPGVLGGPRGDNPFTVADVLLGALKFSPAQMDMRAQKRVGGILRSLGYISITVRSGRDVVRRWVHERRK